MTMLEQQGLLAGLYLEGDDDVRTARFVSGIE